MAKGRSRKTATRRPALKRKRAKAKFAGVSARARSAGPSPTTGASHKILSAGRTRPNPAARKVQDDIGALIKRAVAARSPATLKGRHGEIVTGRKGKPSAPALTLPAETLTYLVGDVPRVRGAGRMLAAGPAATIAGMISVAAPATRRMVALPPRGLRSGPHVENSVKHRLLSLHSHLLTGDVRLHNIGASTLGMGSLATSNAAVRVLGSIAETGAKLIEYRPDEENAVRAALPGLRLVPEVFYEPLSIRLSLESDLQPSGSGHDVQVTVRSSSNGKGIPRVKVVSFTNFALRAGAEAFTNSSGAARLTFAVKPGVLDRLYVFADRGFWSALGLSVSTSSGAIQVALAPIDLAQPHALRHYFGEPGLAEGAGVKVGVIDTGSGPHPDLVIAGGFNAVTGENPTQFSDNGDLHGTHVAGIIASRGVAPTGIRGVAPGASVFSYRVFPKGSNASNFDIANAIDKAREQQCDLINLSLGRPAGPSASDEPLVRIALEDAREAGMLAIAAAGNDFRRGVSFPGADELCVAVSALGDKTILSMGSVSAAAAVAPPGTDPNEFIADFSNVGPEIDVTGPGVGVVSTVPQRDFAVMDGTSMACPAVTGLAARLIASKPGILGMARDAARATAIADALLSTARSRGFTANLEGRGFPK